MKRILSILLSVSLIATLLISMSVTSFAEETGGSSVITVTKIAVENEDAEVGTNFGADMATMRELYEGEGELHVYKIHAKITNTKLSSLKKTPLTWYGEYLAAGSFQAWVSPDVAAYMDILESYLVADCADKYELNGAPTANTDDATGQVVFGQTLFITGKPIKELRPYTGSDVQPGEGGDIDFALYFITTTDTFEVNIPLLTYSVSEVPYDKAMANTKDPTQTDGVNSPTYYQPEQTVYVKDGVQVTKDEYEGGGAVTEYTVTFKNGDSVLQSATVVEGAAVTAPEEPTAPVDADPAYNYTFVGWSDGSKTYASNEIPVATNNVEYTAVFNSVKKTVTATFVVEGKANVTETVEYGETPTAAGVDTDVEGKNFTGWSPELGPITTDTIYTAQLVDKAPTQYEITFVVDGDETIVMTNAGISPVYTKGTPSKDGHTFEGWEAEDGTVYTGELPVATANATYEAVFAPIPAVDSNVTITAVDRITGDIFPISGKGTVEVTTLSGKKETIEAARLHRVHTTFTYEPGDNPLVEMGMLFVPEAVVDEAGIAKDAEVIANAGIAKDANCRELPDEITGGVANFIFKAGLVDVPTTIEGKSTKGITIYAIPYYTLSGGARQYHGVIETTF